MTEGYEFISNRCDELGVDAFDERSGHRCPGEGATVALTTAATRLLTTSVTYVVPDQDLDIDLSSIPALPKSGFVIKEVRRSSGAAGREAE